MKPILTILLICCTVAVGCKSEAPEDWLYTLHAIATLVSDIVRERHGPAIDLRPLRIATAGMAAGLEGNSLPDGDDRIIAATRIIGGGDSDSVTFSLGDLAEGTRYAYVCTFPGHWAVMRGTLTVTN